MCNILISLLTGFISGFASGYVVYILTKKREEKNDIYRYWENYLYKTLENCEICIPAESLSNIAYIGDKNSDWYKAIQKIIELTDQFSDSNNELTEKQEEIFQNVLIALKALYEWKKQNKLK